MPVSRGLVWISPKMTDSLTTQLLFFFKANFLTAGWTDNNGKKKMEETEQEWEIKTGHFSLTLFLFLPYSLAPSLCCPVSPVFPRSRREDKSRGIWCWLTFFAHTHSPSQISPPREEGPSALEALRVGLTIGTLWGSSRLHDHWWHLHQLQRSLCVLQSLRQVKNLPKDQE